ncbi:hypothetical protein CRG98_045741 [Punica granatum]|uniref:Uncharacterized protein n=1 Tax=Punica granatum TaxID=22663 RepID=A0A2I0HQY5_PUNGR|nr:hypothetical protein CRG98_045741 [Punica granatum]
MDSTTFDADQDAIDKPPQEEAYHRHTHQQIQELEADDFMLSSTSSIVLSLSLSSTDSFSLFRRTQLERHDNSLFRQENDKLQAENMSLRDAMRNPICTNCVCPAIIGEISLEEQHLRIENARLK